jgi:hypothetical protein
MDDSKNHNEDFAPFFQRLRVSESLEDAEKAAYVFIVTQASEKIKREGATTEEAILHIQEVVWQKVLETIQELGNTNEQSS